MDDPRQQHGNHTWDIVIDYHRCPKCGNIIENRDKYENRFGKYEVDLKCNKCNHQFTVTKKRNPTIGPFWGTP